MLTRAQVRAILDKMETLQDGHFALADGFHSAQMVYPMRVLQMPEYASSLAATLGGAYRTLRPQAVLAGPGAGALVGMELARGLAARLVLATFENGRWALLPGQTIKRGERVVLCEDVLTDRTDLRGRAQLVEALGAKVTNCAVLFDRSAADWPFPWPLESLLKVDAPLLQPQECPQCQAGVPLTEVRNIAPQVAVI